MWQLGVSSLLLGRHRLLSFLPYRHKTDFLHVMNSSNQYWSIPCWIASRSYFTGTEKARTIITNSKWWMHLVLTDISSDLWSILPQRFNLESLRQPLETIGIDLNDTEHRQEVEAFLQTLWQDGVLVTDSATNPEPNRTMSSYQEEARQIASISAAFHEGLANIGILASAFFELTYRCNERCVHCFNPRSTLDHSKELTTSEIITTLVELEAMGTYCVTFSGGEVSLRPDFFEILRDAKRCNFAISVYTNGQTPLEWIEELATFFPQTVGVSLYSANPEIHDATTLRKGSFEQSVRAIETLVKHGIRTTIKCPLMNHTVHGYKELLVLCDRLGGIPQFDVHICPATDSDCSRTIHQIRDPNILALMFREPRLPLYVDLNTQNQGRAQRAMDDSICGAGHSSLSICPDGTVYPCNCLPIPLGNVRSGGIRKIFETSGSLVTWKKAVWNNFNECGLYTDCAYCNFCPGMSMLETGDLFGKSKTCCMTAKVRRNVAFALQNNNDPLETYAQAHAGPFGTDRTFRPPTAANEIPWMQRFEEIRRSGNNVRKSIVPEGGSPADENLTKKMLAGTARFFESGR